MPYLSFYLLISTVAYLLTRVYSFVEFKKVTRNISEDDEAYKYHWDIHVMTLIHSSLFVLIGLYAFSIIITGMVFTRKQYDQLIGMAVLVTTLYTFPMLYILHKTFNQEDPNDGLVMFIKWLFSSPFSDKQGGVSLTISLLIHIQIFVSLLWLSGVSSQMLDNITRLN